MYIWQDSFKFDYGQNAEMFLINIHNIKKVVGNSKKMRSRKYKYCYNISKIKVVKNL